MSVATFERWTADRPLATIGTNSGSSTLPFQGWKSFKEAFAPELIHQVVQESRIPIARILDPFLGSGTTALAAQFLGIHPVGVEVNPFLADLCAAKCTKYDVDTLPTDYERVISRANGGLSVASEIATLPETFVAPGRNGRYLFSLETATHILRLNAAINELESMPNRRLLKVLLGGILIDCSNIRVSGKGRRYRSNWMKVEKTPADVAEFFALAFAGAFCDICAFNNRATGTFDIFNADSRDPSAFDGQTWDACVFSPPYPNSFDYTDVYNVELWMLGYLRHAEDNTSLRNRTLTSHVQIKRTFNQRPATSVTLRNTMEALETNRATLWNRHIPEMVGAYFADLLGVLDNVSAGLTPGGSVWLVVGNSQYGECLIDVPKIIAEIAPEAHLTVKSIDPFRSMRRSPQQGGRAELSESLLVLNLI